MTMSGFDRLTPTSPIVPVRGPAHPADQDRGQRKRPPATDGKNHDNEPDPQRESDTGSGRIDEYA